MGRAIHVIRTRDVPALFSFFDLPMQEEVLESRREEIAALRLAYERAASTVARARTPAGSPSSWV